MALKTNLSAHWKLDEASGTRVDAHSSYDLTDNNTVASAAGKLGNAADFELANSEHLSVADAADLSPTDQSFSVAAWVQLESVNGTEHRHFVDHKNASDDGFACYYNNTNNNIAFHVKGSGGTTNLGHTQAVSTATWYFVVWVYDHTNQLLKISVDGGAFETTAHTGGIFDTSTDFCLGKWGGGPAGYHDGLLDSVSFWLGRVLSDADVDELYNGGAGLDYDDWDAAAAFTPRICLMGVG